MLSIVFIVYLIIFIMFSLTYIIECVILYMEKKGEDTMTISGKVKVLLSANGKDHSGLASALNISPQALSNKFYRDSFSSEDLIIVAEYVGCELAFLSAGGSKIVLEKTDIKPKKTKGE